ncbi:MAG: DNA-directed RNA polymerase subunit H [Methanobacteriota archaeon]|nr:MAG: DNA-directed RNA polymerase subunit H [Euryarchaeota archaeon]
MTEEFNVLEHELVPEHHLMPKKEVDKILKEVGLARDQLPRMRLSDPCIRALDAMGSPIEEGMIVKIVRRSETSGMSVCYRLVVRG